MYLKNFFQSKLINKFRLAQYTVYSPFLTYTRYRFDTWIQQGTNLSGLSWLKIREALGMGEEESSTWLHFYQKNLPGLEEWIRDLRGVPAADCWNWGEWRQPKEYNWKGSFLGWFVGLVVQVQETFILSWLRWSAQYKNVFSSPYLHYFNLCVPIAQHPMQGRQPCRAACLWMCVSGISGHIPK